VVVKGTAFANLTVKAVEKKVATFANVIQYGLLAIWLLLIFY